MGAVPGPLCAWTAEALSPVSRLFRAVATLCLNVDRNDLHACAANFIRTSTTKRAFLMSLTFSVRVNGRPVELIRLIELFDTMQRVGVTTSGAINSIGPPSTVNCRRSGEEPTSGRRAVDVTCRERIT